jgi:predicted metal-dependent HD superfamily phosphohydrolase
LGVNDAVLLARLADSWHDLVRRCGVDPAATDDLLRQLVQSYLDPARHYHNLHHVADVLGVVRAHAGSATEPELLELAAWFHDVVYDPRATDNEERSAACAAAALGRLRLPPDRVARVAALVRMTRDHQADPGDTDAQLLLDADLAILGAAPEAYNSYARAIRQEYSWVLDADYRAGRCAVLRRFLQRPRLFHTEALFQALEVPARRNLTAEIAELS